MAALTIASLASVNEEVTVLSTAVIEMIYFSNRLITITHLLEQIIEIIGFY